MLDLTGSGICTLKYLGSDRLTTTASGVTVGVVTATSFVKTGGTSSQYLMADGSVTLVAAEVALVLLFLTQHLQHLLVIYGGRVILVAPIYYQDTDTTQWVDTNPLTQDRIVSPSAPSSATIMGSQTSEHDSAMFTSVSLTTPGREQHLQLGNSKYY